jgi:uncharacterized membrane protein
VYPLKKPVYYSLLALAVVGFLDSLYLYYVKLTSTPVACFQGSTACETVANSKYASIYGIPNGLVGMLGYAAILCLLIVIRFRPQYINQVRYALFGLSFIGFLYSVYLTSISFFILKAECPFCILSAIMMTGIFVISIFELRNIH